MRHRKTPQLISSGKNISNHVVRKHCKGCKDLTLKTTDNNTILLYCNKYNMYCYNAMSKCKYDQGEETRNEMKIGYNSKESIELRELIRQNIRKEIANSELCQPITKKQTTQTED